MDFQQVVAIGVVVLLLLLQIAWQWRARLRWHPPAAIPVPPVAPRRLSLIGYWSVAEAPPDQAPGWPDPRDLVGGWDPALRRACVAYLGRGTVFREFMGVSSCRICGQQNGSGELTDGTWAWPEGLAHYVEAHDVRLPEAFLAAVGAPDQSVAAFLAGLQPEKWAQGGYEAVSPIEWKATPTWVADDTAWLDWAAANTPARPRKGAASLAEVRALCDRLSHPGWRAEIEEVNGRWRLRASRGEWRDWWYLERCPAGIVERRLLRLRPPDQRHLLTPEQAADIANACAGSWGAIRVIGAQVNGPWFVWSKRASAAWPSTEDVMGIMKHGLRPDQVGFFKGEGKYFIIPPPDEPAWRWVITEEREEREAYEAHLAGGES